MNTFRWDMFLFWAQSIFTGTAMLVYFYLFSTDTLCFEFLKCYQFTFFLSFHLDCLQFYIAYFVIHDYTLDVFILVLIHFIYYTIKFFRRNKWSIIIHYFAFINKKHISISHFLLLCRARVSFTTAMCGFQMIHQRNAAQRLLNDHRQNSPSFMMQSFTLFPHSFCQCVIRIPILCYYRRSFIKIAYYGINHK